MGTKNSTIFKHRFTTMVTPNMVIFSVVADGDLRFINEADGMGVDWLEPYNTYHEWPVYKEIPENNPYDATNAPRKIKGLRFYGFELNKKPNPKASLHGKIDFSSQTLYVPYAICINHSKELVVLNQEIADSYYSRYPNIGLSEFIKNTTTLFEPKTITICGSLKFKHEMVEIAGKLTSLGYLVLTPEFPSTENFQYSPEQMQHLKSAHLKRIDSAGTILVVNPNGYIGESTSAEIAYAQQQDKEILYYNKLFTIER